MFSSILASVSSSSALVLSSSSKIGALTSHQFQVYYQPKYDIYSDTVAGAEALIRWKHPEMGFLSPGEFIPIFERNGFITRLDFYVWEEVCRAISKWKEQGWK